MFYAAAILLFAPDFLTTIVPLIRLAYGRPARRPSPTSSSPCSCSGWRLRATDRRPPAAAASRQSAVRACAAGRRRRFRRRLFHPAQGLDLSRHPALGCASLALAAPCWRASPNRGVRCASPAPALLSLPLVLAAQQRPRCRRPALTCAAADRRPAARRDRRLPRDRTAIAWSVTLQHGFRYASRYNGFWMLRAVVANEQRAGPTAPARPRPPDRARDGRGFPLHPAADGSSSPARGRGRGRVRHPRLLPARSRLRGTALPLSCGRAARSRPTSWYALVSPLPPALPAPAASGSEG